MHTIDISNGPFDFLGATFAMHVNFENDGRRTVVFLGWRGLSGLLLTFILSTFFELPQLERQKQYSEFKNIANIE